MLIRAITRLLAALRNERESAQDRRALARLRAQALARQARFSAPPRILHAQAIADRVARSTRHV